MVFENVTLFEIHLDDASFENTVGGSDDDVEAGVEREASEEREADETNAEASGRSGRLGRVVFALGFALGATYAARRLAARRAESGDEDPVVIEDVDAETDERVYSD